MARRAASWPAGDREANGVTELGRLVTAGVPNDFPRLPVHEDVTVAVWILSDRAGGDDATAAAEASAGARGLPLRTTRLTPTARRRSAECPGHDLARRRP